MPTLPDHHLEADLKQQRDLPEIPTASLSFVSVFSVLPVDATISPQKNAAAASPVDAQISGELYWQLLLSVNILENTHFR